MCAFLIVSVLYACHHFRAFLVFVTFHTFLSLSFSFFQALSPSWTSFPVLCPSYLFPSCPVPHFHLRSCLFHSCPVLRLLLFSFVTGTTFPLCIPFSTLLLPKLVLYASAQYLSFLFSCSRTLASYPPFLPFMLPFLHSLCFLHLIISLTLYDFLHLIIS